jgi:Flp pilus assembly protein protease CpaA
MMAIYVVIFCGAIAQDLLWRKVKNIYVLAAFLAAFLFQTTQLGFIVSLALYQNFLLALSLGIGLYFFKVLGAGDVKIFAASSLLLPLESIPLIYFYSLFWGALFGVIRYSLSGKALTLVHNLIFISNSATRKSVEMQPIPFTVAFLLGALTDWTLRQHGVNIL